MRPKIIISEKKRLIGKKIKMSFSQDKTVELWTSFSPRKKEIKNSVNSYLYSVEIYNNPKMFIEFNPIHKFEKWAAVEVTDFDIIPDEMDRLIIPQGQYAVFNYKGKPSDAQKTFQYIYEIWLPNSKYVMDDRPYMAIMGEKYKGEHPDSEEEFWIPIKNK